MISRSVLPVLLFCDVTALAATVPAAAEASTLYVDANVPATGQNAVLAYTIAHDGSLNPVKGSPFPTGGTGYYDSSYKLGPFDIDQELALGEGGRMLYAANGGSNTVAGFSVLGDGGLVPLQHSPFRSHGSTPVSLGLHGGTMVMLNNAGDPAQAGSGVVPSVTVSRVSGDGGLSPIGGTTVALPATAQPSQLLTTHTGPFVFSAEFPDNGYLRAYYQFPNGHLYQTAQTKLPLEGTTQPLPLGLWAHPTKPYLYVGFVNTNELGVYSWSAFGQLKFVAKAADSGGAICWVRVSADGTRLYAVNTAYNSLSVFDLSKPDAPVEIQHLVVGGFGGLEQVSLTPDGRFLYVLQEENSAASIGKSNKVYVLSVDGLSGELTLLNNLTLQLSVPPLTRPIGVAIR